MASVLELGEAFGFTGENWLTLVALLGAAIWSVINFINSKRIEASRPFLDLQLTLYKSATQATARIAANSDAAEVADATKRFWELYYGELALVEDEGVESQMVEFGNALRANAESRELRGLALDLADACRLSLSKSWKIEVWQRSKDQSPAGS